MIKKGSVIQKLVSVGTVTGLTAVPASKNRVKLTWSAVNGAVGYLVYGKRSSDGTYAFIGMTSATTYTDTKALDTDYNFYWVYAYMKDASGKMITGACEKYVFAKGITSAVTNLRAESQVGGVKLSWSAVSGADGYLVYGYHGSPNNGAAYAYIGMTKGNAVTTFTDKKALTTDYNFYYVYPFHYGADGKMVVGGTAKYVYGKAR